MRDRQCIRAGHRIRIRAKFPFLNQETRKLYYIDQGCPECRFNSTDAFTFKMTESVDLPFDIIAMDWLCKGQSVSCYAISKNGEIFWNGKPLHFWRGMKEPYKCAQGLESFRKITDDVHFISAHTDMKARDRLIQSEHNATARNIHSLRNYNFVSIKCMNDGFIALNDANQLVILNHDLNGKLQVFTDMSFIDIPSQPLMQVPISKIFSCACYAICISTIGEPYLYRSTMITDNVDALQKIAQVGLHPIVKACCDNNRYLLLNDSGELYSCGISMSISAIDALPIVCDRALLKIFELPSSLDHIFEDDRYRDKNRLRDDFGMNLLPDPDVVEYVLDAFVFGDSTLVVLGNGRILLSDCCQTGSKRVAHAIGKLAHTGSDVGGKITRYSCALNRLDFLDGAFILDASTEGIFYRSSGDGSNVIHFLNFAAFCTIPTHTIISISPIAKSAMKIVCP